jgi:hypothetical protein
MARKVGDPARNRSMVMAASYHALMGGDGCWLWLGEINHSGYGLAYYNGRAYRAHRALYEVVNGPVPDGKQLDHLCRNRACVRPSHLEPVTNWENTLRGKNMTAENVRKTHCPRGHSYDSVRKRPGKTDARRCSTCDAAAKARSRPKEHARRRARRAAARAIRMAATPAASESIGGVQ